MSAEIVSDCPRCGSLSITFRVTAANLRPVEFAHGWVRSYELFAICRNCGKATVLIAEQSQYADINVLQTHGPLIFQDSLNNHFHLRGFLSTKDNQSIEAPEHVPAPIAGVFNEGGTCVAVGCWNAASAMFRKCVDLATRELLPKERSEGESDQPGLNRKVRRDLGSRLPWLFENKSLPEDLRELASCIHQDGNDAAHAEFLTEADARDLLDFTVALLERLYTEPAKLAAAAKRRAARRESNSNSS
ncbi:MAG TPA: DUF4145 domain-containing protein [Pirellulales bacterium]|nr:DUF4145 domain-containing protein [Pirellulales bacterium]HVY21651.1 DUF4145 domain-containing protein [Bauldia sp.]